MFTNMQARNYNNHKQVMKIMYKKRQYPNLKIYCLKRVDASARYHFLIVKTGAREQFARSAAVSDLNDAIESTCPGGGFASIHGEGNVADTPDPGKVIVDKRGYEILWDSIKNGSYVVEDVIVY